MQKTAKKLVLTTSSIRTLVTSDRQLPNTSGYPTSFCRTSDEQLKRKIRPL